MIFLVTIEEDLRTFPLSHSQNNDSDEIIHTDILFSLFTRLPHSEN